MEVDVTFKRKNQNSAIAEATALFEQFLETERPLFAREVAGIRYWHFIRFYVLEEIHLAKKWIEKSSRGQQASFFEKIGIGFELIKNSLSHRIALDDKQADVLILNSANKISRDGRFVDPYTDLWLSDFSAPYTIWENPALWRHPKHGASADLFYLDSLHVRALVCRAISKKFDKPMQHEAARLVDFAKPFGVELSHNRIFRLINMVVSLHAAAADYIKRQLQKKRVKLIVLVNHYDPLKMLITTIAKSLEIYVVELQHGTMGRYHIAYNFKITHELVGLPHEIFTFGRFWNETTRVFQNGVRLTAVGSPFYEQKIQNMTDIQPHSKIRVLFLSQETIGRQLAEMAAALSKKLGPDLYEVVYKLHPREYHSWRLNYPKEFADANLQIQTNADLYKLLNQCDVHVGVYSTTIMESLAFGKPLILFKTFGVHHFADLIASGRALLAETVDEMVHAIQHPTKFNSDSKDITYFWETNSKEKLLRRLQEILHDR